MPVFMPSPPVGGKRWAGVPGEEDAAGAITRGDLRAHVPVAHRRDPERCARVPMASATMRWTTSSVKSSAVCGSA